MKNVALDGWVKGALVPIKSHYCRLITQESSSLSRYELGLWHMNNSGGGKDTGIHRYGGVFPSASGDAAPQEKAPVNPQDLTLHTDGITAGGRRHILRTHPVFHTLHCVQVPLGNVECARGLLVRKCMQSPSVGQEPPLIRRGES